MKAHSHDGGRTYHGGHNHWNDEWDPETRTYNHPDTDQNSGSLELRLDEIVEGRHDPNR